MNRPAGKEGLLHPRMGDSSTSTICASWFCAFLHASFLLPLISRDQRLGLCTYIRAASFCLCSLGNAIGCSFVCTSSPTTLFSPVPIFLVYIFQGSIDFEIYWVLGCGPSFFFFCFESVIYNPLHAARRAMAAAVPLPLAGQRRGFYITKPSPTSNQLARL